MPLLTGPLQPAWIVGRVYERLLREIPVDETWVRAVQRAAERGSVVHLVRNVSLLDLLALDHLTQRFGLPRIGFANELGGWLGPEALRGSPSERLRKAVRAGRCRSPTRRGGTPWRQKSRPSWSSGASG